MFSAFESSRFEHNGVAFIVRLYPEDSITPKDFDCYDAADMAAWRRGDWQFVGVSLSVADLDDEWWQLWGVEYGTNPDVFEIGLQDLVQRAKEEGWCDEAVKAAVTTLAPVVDRLQRYGGGE